MARQSKLEKLASARFKAEKEFNSYSKTLDKTMSQEQLMNDKKYQALRSNMHNTMSAFAKKGPGMPLRAEKMNYSKEKGFFPYDK